MKTRGELNWEIEVCRHEAPGYDLHIFCLGRPWEGAVLGERRSVKREKERKKERRRRRRRSPPPEPPNRLIQHLGLAGLRIR